MKRYYSSYQRNHNILLFHLNWKDWIFVQEPSKIIVHFIITLFIHQESSADLSSY